MRPQHQRPVQKAQSVKQPNARYLEMKAVSENGRSCVTRVVWQLEALCATGDVRLKPDLVAYVFQSLLHLHAMQILLKTIARCS